MMVEANDNYIFQVMDLPEVKPQPKRSLILILRSMLSMMLSVLGVLAFHYTRKALWRLECLGNDKAIIRRWKQ